MSAGRDRLEGQPVLVTGASGFIGAHLAERLAGLGARVVALTRGRRALRGPGGVRHVAADLAHEDAGKVLRQVAPRYAFHLAAYTNPARDVAHADEAMAVNLLGTMRLLSVLQDCGTERIVLTGTAEEYGNAPVPVREDAPLQPTSPYSVAKAAATLWALMRHRATGLPVVILRPFVCYGPGLPATRFISQAVAAAVGGRDLPMTQGEQTRDFTHVDDLVEAYIRAALAAGVEGEVFNVATGVETSIRSAAQKIYALAGSTARPRPGALPYRAQEVWRSAACIEKARDRLGWSARIGLDEGLRSMIEGYRRSGNVAAPAGDEGTAT